MSRTLTTRVIRHVTRTQRYTDRVVLTPISILQLSEVLDLVATASNHYSAYRSQQRPVGPPSRPPGEGNGEPPHGRLRQGARGQAPWHPPAAGPVVARRRAEVRRTLEGSRRRLLRTRRPCGDRAEAGRAGRLLR